MLPDLVYHKDNVLNGCFSLSPLKKKENNCYLTDLQPSSKLILDYFAIKKKLSLLPVKNFILHKNISFSEIFTIYTKTFFFLLYKTLKILNKKNYFIIRKRIAQIYLNQK